MNIISSRGRSLDGMGVVVGMDQTRDSFSGWEGIGCYSRPPVSSSPVL